MDMDLIVKWSSIISPLIAVIIAVWSGISSRKATAKQLSAIKESTTKQVESIKELAKIQTKIAALQLDKEAWEARHRWRQVSEESWKSIENRDRMAGVPLNEFTSMMYQRNERDNHLSLEQDFYSKQVKSLDGYTKRIKEIMQELDKK